MRIPLVAMLLAIGPLWLCPLGPARADCEDGVAALARISASATDPHARDVLSRDLKQAQFELWEFDEVECAVALDHAARFLRRDTVAAGASTPPPGNK